MIYDRPINVMLVDDHEVLRKGLRGLLEASPRFRVTAEAAGMEETLCKAQHNEVDLVVTDLEMPCDFASGIELTQRLRAAFPVLYVLIYTMHREEEFILQAIDADAHGYVVKEQPAIDLINAVNKVINGQRVFPPTVNPEKLLTPTERQVFWLLGDGKSNTYIATKLSLQVHTVQDYRSKIWQKLKVVLPEREGNNTLIHHATKYRMRSLFPQR